MTTDQPTQPLDLDAVRAREAAATRGPWIHTGRNHIETPTIDVDEANWGGEGLHGYRLVCDGDEGAWRDADSAFIAAARADIPALLAALAAAHAEIERLHELRRAAGVWRAQFEKPAKLPRMAALIEAVDKLTEENR